MDISERQLRDLVAGIDDRHRDAMATFRDDHREAIFGDLRRAAGPSRRRFLAGAGAASALLTIGSAVVPVRRLIPPAYAQTDVDIAKFAASVEFAVVEAYQAVAAGGKVRTKGVAEAAGVFAGHHQQHGEAFKALAQTDVAANKTLLDMVAGQLGAAANEKAVVEIAYGLENSAAATYLFALGVLTEPKAVEAAASILPVEAQHAIALGTVLGKSLEDGSFMPAFEKSDGFLDPGKYPVG